VEQAWPAVHALVRRLGACPPDAEDLTQAYFVRFIDKEYARRLASWDGCLRPFFLTSLRHFLANARDHARALKRGGRTRTVSLDDALACGRAIAELADAATPESRLASAEHQRAMRRAIAAVQGEARCGAERRRLDRLLSHLEHGEADSGEIAKDWGVSPGAVRVAVHRLRRRLTRALAAEAAAPAATDRPLRFS
jgi:RNA polymerase sigma-70 factor (ECF subfamily)